MNNCHCSGEGYCPVWDKYMTRRYWQFCNGTSGLPKEWEEKLLSKIGLPEKYVEFTQSSFVLERQPRNPSFNTNLPPIEIYNNSSELIIKFLLSLILYALSGFKNVNNVTLVKRISTCNICPNKVISNGTLFCGVCKCNLNLKARWEIMKCPSGYWEYNPSGSTYSIASNGCGCSGP